MKKLKLLFPIIFCVSLLSLLYYRRFYKMFTLAEIRYLNESWAFYLKIFTLTIGLLLFVILQRQTWYPDRDSFLKRILNKAFLRKQLEKIINLYQYLYKNPLINIDNYLDKSVIIVKIKSFFVSIYSLYRRFFIVIFNLDSRQSNWRSILKDKNFTMKNFIAFMYILFPLGLLLGIIFNVVFYNQILYKWMLIGFTLTTINLKIISYWHRKKRNLVDEEKQKVFHDILLKQEEFEYLSIKLKAVLTSANLLLEEKHLYNALELKLQSYVEKFNLECLSNFSTSEEELKEELITFFNLIFKGEKLTPIFGTSEEDSELLTKSTKKDLLDFLTIKLENLNLFTKKLAQEIFEKTQENILLVKDLSNLQKEIENSFNLYKKLDEF